MDEPTRAYDLCAQTVRSDARPRYIASIYAPPEIREDLWALFAFEAEMERVPKIVREPMAGEIRLQWWRDALATGADNAPIAAALSRTIERHQLPISTFDALLDARISDLYADLSPTVADAEGHAGETRSVLYQMAARIILREAQATGMTDRSGHAGVMAYWLAALAQLDSQFVGPRSLFPVDQLIAAGADPSKPFRPADLASETVRKLREMATAEARRHAHQVFQSWSDLSTKQRVPYLSLAANLPVASNFPATGGAGSLRTIWKIWRAGRGVLPSIG